MLQTIYNNLSATQFVSSNYEEFTMISFWAFMLAAIAAIVTIACAIIIYSLYKQANPNSKRKETLFAILFVANIVLITLYFLLAFFAHKEVAEIIEIINRFPF